MASSISPIESCAEARDASLNSHRIPLGCVCETAICGAEISAKPAARTVQSNLTAFIWSSSGSNAPQVGDLPMARRVFELPKCCYRLVHVRGQENFTGPAASALHYSGFGSN